MFAKFHPRRTLVSFFPLTPNPDSLSPKSSPYLVTSLPPYFLFSKSFPCHTSENSPVSPTIATLPKTAVSKPSVCHTSEPPRGVSPPRFSSSAPTPSGRSVNSAPSVASVLNPILLFTDHCPLITDHQLAPLGLPGNRRGTAARRSATERACCLNGTSPLKNAVIRRCGGDGWLAVRKRGEITIDRLAGGEWHTAPARGGRRRRAYQRYCANGF